MKSRRFGALFDRFSRDLDGPEFDPFRKLLQDHLLTTWPLNAGQDVLGVPVPQRLLHSVRSLANQTGLGTVRLRKALAAAGLVATTSPRSDAWDVFDAETAETAETAEKLVLPMLEGLKISDVVQGFSLLRSWSLRKTRRGSIIKTYIDEAGLQNNASTTDNFWPPMIVNTCERFGIFIEVLIEAVRCAVFSGSPSVELEHF